MDRVRLLLLTIATVGDCMNDLSLKSMSSPTINISNQSPNQRYKRSDCLFYIDASCQCTFGYCWVDSYRFSFSSNCGTSFNVACCTIGSLNTYQLSNNCPVDSTYMDLQCYQSGLCADGIMSYRCTCSEGYLLRTTTTTTTTTTYTTTTVDNTVTIALGVGLPSVAVIACIVVAVLLYYRRVQRRRKDAELKQKVLDGIIPVHCNVMVMVDDVDAFKLYSTRLMVALQNKYPKLVFERLSIFDVIYYNYEIECDKLLVLRAPNRVKDRTLSTKRKKVIFRNEKDHSNIVEIMEEDSTKMIESKKSVDETCLVPSIDHIENWLPAVIKTLFKVNNNCLNIRNKRFCIKEMLGKQNSEFSRQLRYSVETVLASFGSTEAPAEGSSRCSLVFLHSIKEEDLKTDRKNKKFRFIFVASGVCEDRYKNIPDMKHVYGKNDLIKGIVVLLFKMNIISRKKLPEIKAVKYNPMTKEFV